MAFIYSIASLLLLLTKTLAPGKVIPSQGMPTLGAQCLSADQSSHLWVLSRDSDLRGTEVGGWLRGREGREQMPPAAKLGHVPEEQTGGSNLWKGRGKVSGRHRPTEPSEVPRLHSTAGADGGSQSHSLGLQHVAAAPWKYN